MAADLQVGDIVEFRGDQFEVINLWHDGPHTRLDLRSTRPWESGRYGYLIDIPIEHTHRVHAGPEQGELL